MPARLVRVDRGSCEAVTGDGRVRAEFGAEPAADPSAAPCSGDWAALLPGPRPTVQALLPRRTAIVRASAARDSHGQVLAANVDTIVVAVSLATWPDLGRLERLLALAWDSGATPVVALTQADRATDAAEAQEAVRPAAPGVEVLITSAHTGEGVPELAALLTGTVALIGVSGAGKSSLGNALLGAELLATGEVRAGDGKGRHTTVTRELFPLPGGGVLIDTPGLRSVGLHGTAEGVDRVFADIEELAAGCRFADCGHVAEPGCAVLAAVESGELPLRRLLSHRKLSRENEWAASRTDARLRAERAGRLREITRNQRAMYRVRGRKR
ncbi:ribosome small subunit-dependent GTPase A [Streptomyces hoynatensis]|uniref:ribosome small subunit-dependent GTPase A n=1 Tax=Streptomyces hoynatensis TaxID=1141874 RepID=UPI001F4DC619|nr:ribosome small subunit-dependent GTPase A [Streptomyces hoynatensis]